MNRFEYYYLIGIQNIPIENIHFFRGQNLLNFGGAMAENKYTFLVSDETKNTYGMRVISSGGDFERFLKNPVMLDLHDRKLVLGKWENLRVEGTQIFADAIWDEEDPEVLKVKGKYDRGFQKGCSMGIEPVKSIFNDDDQTLEIVEWILKEISTASVPSNGNSLVLYDKNGSIMNEENILTFAASNRNQEDLIHTMKNIKLFAKTLQLADTATEDEVLLAVNALAEKNLELADANKTLLQKLKDAEKNKSVALVDGAISANKILPAEREDYIALADANYDTTKKLLDAKKPFVGLSDRAAGSGAAGSSDKTKDWGWDEFHKSGKLADLKMSDPDRYAELYKEKFKVAPKA